MKTGKTEAQMLEEIRAEVAAKNQKQVAKMLNVSPQHLCDVLKGRRGITENIALRMGYKRVVKFEPAW